MPSRNSLYMQGTLCQCVATVAGAKGRWVSATIAVVYLGEYPRRAARRFEDGLCRQATNIVFSSPPPSGGGKPVAWVTYGSSDDMEPLSDAGSARGRRRVRCTARARSPFVATSLPVTGSGRPVLCRLP